MAPPKHRLDRRPRHRLDERPRLLIDLGEKVSEDLQIITPATPALLAVPSALKGPGGIKSPKSATSLAITSPAGTKTLTGARSASAAWSIRDYKAPEALVRKIANRIRKMFPEDGEAIFSIVHYDDHAIGEPWRNDNDWMFWVATEYQVIQSVYEWMNSEVEAITDMIGYDETLPIELANDRKAHPSTEQLVEAWEHLIGDQPKMEFEIEVEDVEGIPVDTIVLTAEQLMQHLGLSVHDIIPTLILADSVTPEDHARLYGCNDEEVYLDHGYVVTGIVVGDDYTCVHINPL